MQLVDAPHERQIGRTDRARHMLDRCASDTNGLGLFGNRERVISVNDPLALSSPALVSAHFRKIIFQRQFTNLCSQRHHLNSGLPISLAGTSKRTRGSLNKQSLPLGDLRLCS